jgi:hypothetical protein
MSRAALRLRWSRREPPLHPAAVAASGQQADQLRIAVRARLEAGADLRATADANWLVTIGEAADLPWVDGAIYLGWDAGLLVPTTLLPWPGPELVRASLSVADNLVVLLPDRMLISEIPRHRADPQALTPEGVEP